MYGLAAEAQIHMSTACDRFLAATNGEIRYIASCIKLSSAMGSSSHGGMRTPDCESGWVDCISDLMDIMRLFYTCRRVYL